MKAERRKPCGNCPFRKSAPLAYWHPSEYLMLQRLKKGEEEFGTSRGFLCHKDRTVPKEDKELCVGWLLYQREHGVPSIAARLQLMKPEVLAQFEESEPDGDLYTDIDELVRDNLEADMEKNPERYE